MKRVYLALAIMVSAVGLSACEREADVASRNVSRAADEFEVVRRIVFVNSWTDNYLLSIEGHQIFRNSIHGNVICLRATRVL